MLGQDTVENLIKTFRLVITNMRIYPPTSQIVTKTIDSFFNMVYALITTEKKLTISQFADKLMINSTEPKAKEVQMAANVIIKLFSQREIQSITFKEGLTRDELLQFLNDLLKKKREELSEYPSILLDQTVYVATVKGEEAVMKISETINKSQGDIVGIIKSVRESFDMIDGIADPNTQENLQNHVAQELAKQDVSVLRDIFDRDLPLKLEQSGIKQRLLSALSKEKIQEIFGEIADWYEEIRKSEESDFAAVDKLEKLKGFMEKILKSPAAKEVPRQFFDDLLRKGLINEIPEWFSSEKSKPTSIFEAEKLLEKSPAELLEKDIKDNLPQLAERLCQIEYDDLLSKLIERLLSNLENTAPKIRLPAIQSISAIYDVLVSHNKERLIRFMELPIYEAFKKETSSDVYQFMADILRERARQNLLHANHEASLGIIETMRRHTSTEIMADQQIRNKAKTSLDSLLPQIMDVLIEDLKSDDDKKRSNSMQILLKFPSQAVDPLIKIIKESHDVRSRKLAALAIKNFGEPAIKRFIEELNLGLTSDEIIRVIEAFASIGEKEIAGHLDALLRYPDPKVKTEIMQTLAELNTAKARILLINQLKSDDYSIVEEAAKQLSKIRCREAVPAMTEILDFPKTPLNLQEELCIFLGMIQDYRAVGSIIKKLKKGIHWFTQNKTYIERIKMRAAWALRRFSGQEVEKALEKSSKDKLATVAQTAKESLFIVQQGTSKK